ncbi:hypothetical protein FQN60_000656, partial [Etheostoma spectabile]
MAASGGSFIAAALTQLVPVSWSAHTIIIEFYSPLIPSGQKMEIGAALYLGWAAAALLLIGGSILCCSCPPQEEKQIRDSHLANDLPTPTTDTPSAFTSLLTRLPELPSSTICAQCTNCIDDEPSKAKVMIIAGIFFILAGLLVLIPVSWTASVLVQDFYNPMLISEQKRELGASLYIGWGAAVLLLIGGAMLCSSCPPKEKQYKPPRMAYSAPRSVSAGGGYDRKDYGESPQKDSEMKM